MDQPGAADRGDSPPYVMSFVGENANGILRWWTAQILHGFAGHGFAHVLIDLREPDWQTRMADCLVIGKPAFCFSFQGFGMDLRLDNKNYWSRNEIPFLSYLGDNPYHAPALHSADGPGLHLLYGCIDFLETYRDHFKGRCYASVLRYGYPHNPRAHDIAWAAREHRIVYVKSGVNPSQLAAQWASLPRPMRDVLHQSAEEVLSGTDLTVAAVCRAAFDAHQVHCGAQLELFLFACSMIDRYARAVRAERMVRALMRHDALIVGDWSYLDCGGARARFHPPVAADTLDALYARAKVVVNTSPSVRHGMHERIMAGFFARSAVVSDTTPFLQNLLAGFESFHGLDIDDAAFSGALDAALHQVFHDPAMPEKLDRSAELAQLHFGFEDFVQSLLDQLSIEQHRRNVARWSFAPGR